MISSLVAEYFLNEFVFQHENSTTLDTLNIQMLIRLFSRGYTPILTRQATLEDVDDYGVEDPQLEEYHGLVRPGHDLPPKTKPKKKYEFKLKKYVPPNYELNLTEEDKTTYGV